MGGYGSGRPGWHPKADQFRSIDVNRLRKAGSLKAGKSGGWQWTVDGEKVASISMRAEPARLILIYRIRPGGGDWESVEEPITLTESSCHYGGTRPWFLCPGVRNGRWCGKRVGKLYLGQRYFVCRHCLRLAYSVSRKNPWTDTTAAQIRYAWRWAGNRGRLHRRPESPRGCTGAPTGGRWTR